MLDVGAINASNYQSMWAQITCATNVQAGDTLTVTITRPTNLPLQAVTVGCSYAVSATVGGASASLVTMPGLYDWYIGPNDGTPGEPVPDGGNAVNVPADINSVMFTIDPAALTEGQTETLESDNLPSAYYGPWVVLGGTITGDPIENGDGFSSATPFTITGNNDRLAFMQQPSNTAVGDKMSPPVTVAAENASGGVDTSENTKVTLSLNGTGSVGGTATASVVNGVATFSNLTFGSPGANEMLTATASDSTVSPSTSNSFNVTGGKLVFIHQPGNASIDAAIAPPIQVALENSKGKILSDDSTPITLSAVGISADASANAIGGTVTATPVRGVATFRGVTMNQAGTFELTADDGVDTQGTSHSFNVLGDHLRFFGFTNTSDVSN